jgi:hypothetical protein
MKLSIINEKQIFTTILDKPLRLSEIKKAIMITHPKYFPSDFNLMDNNQILADSCILKILDEEMTLHVIQSEIPKKKVTGQTPIDELIQQATNATTKIKAKNKNVSGTLIDRVSILEQMMNSTVSSLNNSNLSNRAAQLNEIQNLLRTLMEQPRDIQRQSEQVVADENLVNNLKDMGFPEDRCRQALIRARNNINRATDLLLNDELDYVQERYLIIHLVGIIIILLLIIMKTLMMRCL